ncbi:hypothetical protein GCM10011320_59960 [Neoroseomonas lacus]|uniref:Uncharacterized protein n=1 Tax=Neoroseomonas lacus TaxID=287609 RepID=A0A917NZM4_9PROT|nr:hypothetical protein GCM10011320_59960 [Neoroseomonas lacus]
MFARRMDLLQQVLRHRAAQDALPRRYRQMLGRFGKQRAMPCRAAEDHALGVGSFVIVGLRFGTRLSVVECYETAEAAG